MVRAILIALICLLAASMPARAERIRLGTFKGDGPFAMMVGESAAIVEKSAGDARLRMYTYGAPEATDGIGGNSITISSVDNDGKPLDNILVVPLRPDAAGPIVIKFVTVSQLPNGPRTSRTVRIQVKWPGEN
jgi:hypothetical protein